MPADRPQEPESLDEWRDEVVRSAGIDFNPHFALEYHTNAYLHAVVEGAALRLRATCQERDHIAAMEREASDAWRARLDAACQERDTLRAVVAEVVACDDGWEAAVMRSGSALVEAAHYKRTDAAMDACRAVLREVPANPSGES